MEELTNKLIKEIQKRLPIVKECLTKEEMLMIEKETGRYVEKKMFDTKTNKWSKGNSDLFNCLKNQSHFIIVIETTEGMKFGCYITSKITDEGNFRYK